MSIIGSDKKGKYTFADKEFIWDRHLEWYGIENFNTKHSFFLINIDDLTELISQLDENNLKKFEMMKKFGLLNESDLKQMEKWKETKEDLVKQKINFLDKFKDKVCKIIDNLANQILSRCIIVANRLTHGVDKESEENIMKLGLEFQKCAKIPKPKIFSELPEKQAQIKLEELVDQVLSGDKTLLQRLADLPYISQWVKEKLKEQQKDEEKKDDGACSLS